MDAVTPVNPSDPRGYLDRLAATVEERGAARLLQAVITLADETPKRNCGTGCWCWPTGQHP